MKTKTANKPQKTIAQQTAELLRSAALSMEDRNLLTTVLLDRLGALPIRARILSDGKTILAVDGKPLNEQKAIRLRSSARSLYNNFALKFVRETIDFMAVKEGIHNATTPEQVLFAKAILWQHDEEQKLIYALATIAVPEEQGIE